MCVCSVISEPVSDISVGADVENEELQGSTQGCPGPRKVGRSVGAWVDRFAAVLGMIGVIVGVAAHFWGSAYEREGDRFRATWAVEYMASHQKTRDGELVTLC